MSSDPPKPDYRDAHALHPELRDADDEKLRRILAVVDDLSDPAINQALLDPLRPRLASLKPVRPLRFARLLFLPLDPLTVSLEDWQPTGLAIPRPILTPIASIVRAGLGGLGDEVDAIIAAGQGDMMQAITQAGKVLWPAAAEVLAVAPIPPGWPPPGLPSAEFRPLAASIAAVLRRAPRLRHLARDQEVGTLEPDAELVTDLLRDIGSEAATGCAMIAYLLLVRAPDAFPLLRRILSAGHQLSGLTAMTEGIARGIETVLADMERRTAFVASIGDAALGDVGAEARRVTAILRAIETDPGSAAHQPRLSAIRARLDATCHQRLTRGIGSELISRLSAAPSPVNGPAQTELESVARSLRILDVSARKVGAPESYDRLLTEAARSVRDAAEAGTLTPVRYCRLLELLAGAEVAEAAWLKAAAKP